MYISAPVPNDPAGAECALIEQFEAFIRDKTFPCVGAKSALARRQVQFLVAGDIRCPRDDKAVFDTLRDFAQAFRRDPQPFQSFVVLFQTQDVLPEDAFERAMWARLQAFETMDAQRGYAYDPRVSPDISDAGFSLSFAGEAFFAVGLHPGASRPARRFAVPAIVFNPHNQFETLRAEGRYESLRASIIDRDIALAGSANPMLARHGESSEARQYSGRAVGEGWQCPFRPVHKARGND